MTREREEPYLHVDIPSGEATAVALVLHGGRVRGVDPVPPWSSAALRMLPFATALKRAGAGDGLVVARIRYRQRGWNGSAQAPVHDTRQVLDQLVRRFPDRPIGLVGHSMGGRTAIYAANHDGVRSVVGLAPWIEQGDPVERLRDRQVLFVHGDADHTTSPRASAAVAATLQGVARTATFVSIHGGTHAMLRRPVVWHELASEFTVGALLGKKSKGTTDAEVSNVVMEALGGTPSLAL